MVGASVVLLQFSRSHIGEDNLCLSGGCAQLGLHDGDGALESRELVGHQSSAVGCHLAGDDALTIAPTACDHADHAFDLSFHGRDSSYVLLGCLWGGGAEQVYGAGLVQ